MAKPKRPKRVQVELIPRGDGGKTRQPYAIMDELVAAHHAHLADAKIALAWRKGLKPDVDDRLVLGKCKKSSDLDRELHGYDFVILLNYEKWNAAGFSTAEMTALLDHELCHAAVSEDENGDNKVDERGRPIWRVRKHDIEEFREIVERHGLWKGDLESFAASALKAKRQPLFDNRVQNIIDGALDEAASGKVKGLRPSKKSGLSAVSLSSNGRTVTLTPDGGTTDTKNKPRLATA